LAILGLINAQGAAQACSMFKKRPHGEAHPGTELSRNPHGNQSCIAARPLLHRRLAPPCLPRRTNIAQTTTITCAWCAWSAQPTSSSSPADTIASAAAASWRQSAHRSDPQRTRPAPSAAQLSTPLSSPAAPHDAEARMKQPLPEPMGFNQGVALHPTTLVIKRRPARSQHPCCPPYLLWTRTNHAGMPSAELLSWKKSSTPPAPAPQAPLFLSSGFTAPPPHLLYLLSSLLQPTFTAQVSKRRVKWRRGKRAALPARTAVPAWARGAVRTALQVGSQSQATWKADAGSAGPVRFGSARAEPRVGRVAGPGESRAARAWVARRSKRRVAKSSESPRLSYLAMAERFRHGLSDSFFFPVPTSKVKLLCSCRNTLCLALRLQNTLKQRNVDPRTCSL
jgi:hypothetical protein